jgi:hypothetical protein
VIKVKTDMGKQYNKTEKRQRNRSRIKRLKAKAKSTKPAKAA